MSPSKVPDEKWQYVDARGHGHFWRGKELPTLIWVVTGKEWVGDEYDGSEVEIGEYRCIHCEEVVHPEMRLEYGPRYVAGQTWITLTIDGEEHVLTPKQFNEVIDEWKDYLRKVRQ